MVIEQKRKHPSSGKQKRQRCLSRTTFHLNQPICLPSVHRRGHLRSHIHQWMNRRSRRTLILTNPFFDRLTCNLMDVDDVSSSYLIMPRVREDFRLILFLKNHLIKKCISGGHLMQRHRTICSNRKEKRIFYF